MVFYFLVLIKLISLLGKNFAKDTTDFGKDSLASRRHLGTGREDFPIFHLSFVASCVLHTRSQTRFVDCKPCETRDASSMWCICVDSRDFFIDKHFRGHAHSGLTGTRASWASFRIDVVAVAAETANCVVSMRMACRNFRLVVRMLWHLHGPNFHVHVFNLGAAHMNIERALSGAARSPLCRLTVSCGFTSARARIRRSFTCLVCVSVTATRPCPSRTRHHCNRLPHCSQSSE